MSVVAIECEGPRETMGHSGPLLEEVLCQRRLCRCGVIMSWHYVKWKRSGLRQDRSGGDCASSL